MISRAVDLFDEDGTLAADVKAELAEAVLHHLPLGGRVGAGLHGELLPAGPAAAITDPSSDMATLDHGKVYNF